MAVFNQTPITHHYVEVDSGKSKGVRYYELIKVEGGIPQLTPKIQISKDRQCARSKPHYWLKIRLATKWSRTITGLFKTAINALTFFGDIDNKRHLVIFEFAKDASSLKIHYHKDYYPFDKRLKPHTVAQRIKKTLRNKT